MKKSAKKMNVKEERVQLLAQSFLTLRQIQDKTDAAFLASLGNLNMQELNVINIIGDQEPCTMSEIAKRALLSLSSITIIVNKLVKAKLVSRIRTEEDRRVVRGALTAKGKEIYLVQLKHMNDFIRKMLNPLTVTEQESLLKIFDKLTQAWKN